LPGRRCLVGAVVGTVVGTVVRAVVGTVVGTVVDSEVGAVVGAFVRAGVVLTGGAGAGVAGAEVGLGSALSPTPTRGGKSMTFSPARAPCMNAVQILTG
jgi:hypothetical protein